MVRASASEVNSSGLSAPAWDRAPHCEACDAGLVFGGCDICGQLFCLPERLSPFVRLSLEPHPVISSRDLTSATMRALTRWDPLKLHKMCQPLSAQQRALFIRDASTLQSRSRCLHVYYQHLLTQTGRPIDVSERGLSERERAAHAELLTRHKQLTYELNALPEALTELIDVDAHQDQSRMISRLSRSFHSLCAQLASLMLELAELKQSQPNPLSAEPPVLRCTTTLNDLIKRLLFDLRRFEALMSSFEQPTRARWGER